MPDVQFCLDAIIGRGDAPPPPFVCSWTDGGLDAAWVHLAGELDIAAVPHLEQTLREPQLQGRLVVLDLRELEFIDSCGAHAIVNATTRARQTGRRVVVVRGPRNVDRVFTLAAASDDVEIGDIDSVESAVGGLLKLADQGLAL